MIVHIPHDGRWMPYGLSEFDGRVTLLRDFGARQVFEGGHGTCLVFPIDRLVCDVERFLVGEPMEAVGMGVCYERNADLGHLRTVNAEMRADIVRRFYEPHHARLATLVDDEVDRYGRCLIVDGHTFSAVRRGYEASEVRPQIDVGHDGDEPSVAVARLVIDRLRQWYDVMVNEPFAGSLRPLSRIGDRRVASVMIEVRQDLDMELARKRVQGVLAEAERTFYDGTGHSETGGKDDGCPDDGGKGGTNACGHAGGRHPFSDAERHRRLDDLATKYGHLDGFQDVVYAAWDDGGLDSEGLTQIEMRTLGWPC